MAWLQADPSGNYHVSFRFGGRKFKRSLRTKDAANAEGRRLRLEENIRLVESGRLPVPREADVPTFLLSDGKLDNKVVIDAPITLISLFDSFFAALSTGNLEESTVSGMQIHRRHLERHLGNAFVVQRISLEDLQTYVMERSKQKGLRGRNVGGNTIGKEIETFRAAWNWGVDARKLKGKFPKKGLRFPKQIEMPAFQTWDEIERQIEQGNLSDTEQADLWDCLFLTLDEIDELLKHVKETARQPFIYPMFVMAAHTGARRSEMLRSQTTDFNGDTVTIRERKRVRGKQSTRSLGNTMLLVVWSASPLKQTSMNWRRKIPSPGTPKTVPRVRCKTTPTLTRSIWRAIESARPPISISRPKPLIKSSTTASMPTTGSALSKATSTQTVRSTN
ncbi:MAG TPA: hypothetical protein P5307_24015 [Pirellulaceae bacterium]|nr:site-specific integrase [Planctomycetales bacterium]HRX82162.1 hypothetical protein [Pirellulaceae bacterium]